MWGHQLGGMQPWKDSIHSANKDQIKAKGPICPVTSSELMTDTGGHMIHAEGGHSDQNHSFVVDLVATWKHRGNPSKINVKFTIQPSHAVQVYL